MSVSQQQTIPSQAPAIASPSVAQVQSPLPSNSGSSSPHTAAPASSYANATKRSAAGNSSHVKTDSVNGKNAIPPAVPSLGGPTIVNGNHAMSSILQGDHSRKPSVTISAAGTSGHMPNGGPVGGKPAGGNGIQFGQIPTGASPAPSTPQVPSSLAVSSPSNPRITSPQTSPSPIPQPPASGGGKPPSSLHAQGNGLSFGSLGGDDLSRQYRQSMPSGPPGSLTPGMQATHLRRESSQSAHSDMGNPAMGPNAGRGGFQQGGRGRGFTPPYPQQMPYSPNPGYRPTPNQPRGGQNMGNQYQNRGQPLAPPFAGPHPGGRSPSLSNAQPIHPQQGQMPMPSPQMQPNTPYGGYPQHMGPPQGQYGVPYDPNYPYYAPYMQHPGMAFMPPSSPRPPYGVPQGAQQHYIPGQYGNQPTSMSMSRTSSAVSDRPTSAVGQPQTPMTPAVNHQVSANRGTNSPAPKNTNFQIPVRKSAGIVIKDPNSGAIKSFDKAPASPAPPSKSPAIISGTPTPPPRTPSHDSQHARAESKVVKSDEEKKNDMRDAIARKIEADKEEERRQQEEAKRQEEEEAKLQKEAEAAKAAKQAEEEEEAKKAEEARLESERAAAAAKEAESKEAEETEEEKAERLQREEDEMYAEIERKEQEAEEAYQKKRVAEKAERELKAAQAAAKEEEDLKQQEREAEAAEEARLKKLEETEGDDKKERVSLFEALKDKQSAPQSPAVPATADTPTASGAATPVSDSSAMGPPPSRSIGGGKSKPAALKLETSKTVEAPQPSAALMSLRSARFLTVIDDSTYPAAIASPNPALNTKAPMGRFRYDINFLTQFQPVFVEKPSETWTQKVKETVGDTSETPASARGPRAGGPMSSRTTSQRGNVISGAPFGAFGAFAGAGRTIPPGTTSAQRFDASSKGAIRYNANTPGGFPMGFAPQMARTASSSSMGHPQSPRNNTSHRGTGGRGSKGGKPQRENDKDAKTMPLTAGMDLKPIEVSATGWKPRSVGANAAGMSGPPPGGDGYLAPDVVQRKVKASLNKMTPSTFDKIATQILDIVAQSKKETDGRTLRQVIQLTFEKATDEAHWAQMYAEFCSRMLAYMTPEIKDETIPLDKNGNVTAGGTLFRKYLLNRCQQDFEAGWKGKLPEKPEGESEEAAMLSDAYYIAAAAKRRGLGLVRFIGELYKLGMLTSRIMHMCVKRLVDFEGMPDEAEVESLTGLLKTIGENLDSEEKARPMMDAYFDRIKAMEAVDGLPSRLKFMLMDIIDLRKKGWKSKDTAAKGPVTLEEIKLQAAAAEREKDAQRAADNSRRGGGGGGGRMNLGRGDARNFSGGNQFMPPPDYQKNTVGMDDLRRLGNRNNSRQASQQGAISLGPSSMFNVRGSNTGRKTLGPGGMLGRGGEDSGASSRTATPPVQKKEREEKEAAHQNAFSALAALDSGEAADPTSPPSSASSPPVANAKTLLERTRSKSPLAQGKDGDKA